MPPKRCLPARHGNLAGESRACRWTALVRESVESQRGPRLTQSPPATKASKKMMKGRLLFSCLAVDGAMRYFISSPRDVPSSRFEVVYFFVLKEWELFNFFWFCCVCFFFFFFSPLFSI